MKTALALFALFAATTASADLETKKETYETEIWAERTLAMPGGSLQIIAPRVPLDHNAFDEDDALFAADSATGEAICSEVNRKLIGFQHAYTDSSLPIVAFDSNGAMRYIEKERNLRYAYITIVSCRQ